MELYHHGILGQKWGLRRYQNEDGSLTPAGQKRYLKGEKYRIKARKRIDQHYGAIATGLNANRGNFSEKGYKQVVKHYVKKHYDELEKLAKMTTDELLEEKHAYRMKVGASIVKELGGIPIAPLISIPAYEKAEDKAFNKLIEDSNNFNPSILSNLPDEYWLSMRRGVDPIYRKSKNGSLYNKILRNPLKEY